MKGVAKLASIYIQPPDELEEDNNVNISNLHATLTSAIQQMNYVLGNIDTDNFTEDIANAIENLTKENENG